MGKRLKTTSHPLQLEYRGYEWAVENRRWEQWGLSRQQYFKYIRTLGLGRDVEKRDREEHPR